MRPETRNATFDSDNTRILNEIQKQNKSTERAIQTEELKRIDKIRSFKLTEHIFSNFHDRLKKSRREWNYKNDNSRDWNEWANRNPGRARDICLENEYFYGESKTLPKSWEVVIEKWDKMTRGDLVIDDCTYQPKIFDELET